jgi:hypothetical protein
LIGVGEIDETFSSIGVVEIVEISSLNDDWMTQIYEISLLQVSFYNLY